VAQPAMYHNPISLGALTHIHTLTHTPSPPVVADADREKLEQCDSKYARYLCKLMGVYFDYHRDGYFIKGSYTLVSSKERQNWFCQSICSGDRVGCCATL
jgi:hypothetical protein